MRMKFSGKYASSSDVVPKFDKKKGLQRKLKRVCRLNRVKINKSLHYNLVLYSAGIWDLLVLTATFLSNHPNAYSQWREC